MEIKLEAILRARDGRLHNLIGLTAQLWDEDPIADDLLAEGTVFGKSPLFRADFSFDPRSVASADSLGEKTPDLYVLVKNDVGQTLFRSVVLRNIEIEKRLDHPTLSQLEFVES